VENFTAKDISTIIRACRDTGVRSLDCGGLKLQFHEEAPAQVLEPVNNAPYAADMEVEEISVEDDEDLRELELQNMMLSDPVAYEKHMRYEDDRQ
jgi:hypothetical protein